MLSPIELKTNYTKFRNVINENFSGERLIKLNKLYDDYEERLTLAPASSFDMFHNAFPGGYCDHVLRVYDFSLKTYKLWSHLGLTTDNFTQEELVFSALNHDLGKLGFPGDGLDHFVVNPSDWHVKNQGKLYNQNSKAPYFTVSDKTMYVLQKYHLDCTINEYQAIKIHDGIYDEANKPYYVAFSTENKMRCNLPMILHQADFIASRYEFERWAKNENKLDFRSVSEWKIEYRKNLEQFVTKDKNEFDEL